MKDLNERRGKQRYLHIRTQISYGPLAQGEVPAVKDGDGSWLRRKTPNELRDMSRALTILLDSGEVGTKKGGRKDVDH